MASKPVHSIILDAGPIIKSEPPISSLLQQCEQLLCVPLVLSEIRDPAARTRLETTVLPFLQVRNPRSESVKLVRDFARKTGDYSVLSEADVQVIALAYDVECERNGGNWRLRSEPGQKRTNGPLPMRLQAAKQDTTATEDKNTIRDDTRTKSDDYSLSSSSNTYLNDSADDSDSEGWITPSNINRHGAERPKESSTGNPGPIQVAIMTTDYAMQNVILQMNLNLMAPSLQRVQQIKSFVLRCHACFLLVRDVEKQFCPRCGKPTLTRVACSTNQNGEFVVHLKKNMQWNNRGIRYSMPKPAHGAANQRVKGGGKGGWGNHLILAEDQKEYVRAMADYQKHQHDTEEGLDDIGFTKGPKQAIAGNGKPRIGAGRNVNSRKR